MLIILLALLGIMLTGFVITAESHAESVLLEVRAEACRIAAKELDNA